MLCQAWDHAKLCDSLTSVSSAAEVRLGRCLKAVTRLMGANTTTPIPGSKTLTSNFDTEILAKLKQFDLVCWDGDMYHERSFTRCLLSLVQSEWDGIVVAARLRWQLDPFLDHPQWAKLHESAPSKVYYVPVVDERLQGKVGYNSVTKVADYPKPGTPLADAFKAAMDRMNLAAFELLGASHMTVVGGGFFGLGQVKAQLAKPAMTADVYAVSRYDDSCAGGTAGMDIIADWAFRNATQPGDTSVVEISKGHFEATFTPVGLAGKMVLHYGDDIDSVLGTSKTLRTVQALQRIVEVADAIKHAEQPFESDFGKVEESKWGVASPNLLMLLLDTDSRTELEKRLLGIAACG